MGWRSWASSDGCNLHRWEEIVSKVRAGTDTQCFKPGECSELLQQFLNHILQIVESHREYPIPTPEVTVEDSEELG